MKKFIYKILSFTVLLLIAGEICVRLLHLTSDIPRRAIDKYGIQKYIPNQNGYWVGGEHSWKINKLGWAGDLPNDYNNLITIIGDSFIENFMNPNECHQAMLLKNQLPEYNYFEAGRSGVSLIESLEIAKKLDSLNPKYQLIYLGDNDFTESITQISRKIDITQIDLESKKIYNGILKKPLLKSILYNWKFAYYVKNRFPIKFDHSFSKKNKTKSIKNDLYYSEYRKLLEIIVSDYNTENIIFILKPNTTNEVVKLINEYHIQYLKLFKKNTEEWSFKNDHHWTCTGHNKAAIQIADYLKKSP